MLLLHPGLGHADRQVAYALDHADAFSHANRAARIEDVEQVRALERLVVRRKQWEARNLGRIFKSIEEIRQPLAFRLVQRELLPHHVYVG